MIEKLLKSRKLILTFLFFSVLFGFYQYNSLPKESDPDISLPVIYVSIVHKGISPLDSERLLVKPLEKELKNIEGLKKLTTNSFQGGGNVILEFDAGFNSEKALSDTRVKIDLIKSKQLVFLVSQLLEEHYDQFHQCWQSINDHQSEHHLIH